MGISPSFQCFPFQCFPFFSLLAGLREVMQMLLLLYTAETPAIPRRTLRSGSALPVVEEKEIA